MKKIVLFSLASLLTAYPVFRSAANEPVKNSPTTVVAAEKPAQPAMDPVSAHIRDTYEQIDFSNSKKLSFEVFEKAYTGYLNLKASGKLSPTQELLTIADFSQSSTKDRLWIIDLKKNKVVFNTLVAHGQGSGNEFATAFSNTTNSHQSSLGFYVTGETYTGKHGLSLRLHGMDQGYNSAAYDRAVVMHGADYVSEDFVRAQNRLGRSWGCPAVSRQLATPIINTIKNGTVLFVYHPKADYQKSSVWLNKKVEHLPAAIEAPVYANQQPAATTGASN